MTWVENLKTIREYNFTKSVISGPFILCCGTNSFTVQVGKNRDKKRFVIHNELQLDMGTPHRYVIEDCSVISGLQSN